MSVAPDLRFRVFGADEGLSADAAIVAQAKDLAGVIIEFLGAVLVMALANGKKKIAVEENHASAVVEAIFRVCISGEDALAYHQFIVAQGERGRPLVAWRWWGPAE